MKIKSGFMLRQLGSQYVAVPIGIRNNDFKGMIKLNETASKIWQFIAEANHTKEEIIDFLMTTYGIDQDLATEEVSNYIAILQEHGLVDEAS